MGRSRYKILDPGYPYFMTSSVVGRYPLFNDLKVIEILLDGLDFLITKRKVRIYSYVIMPNHLHLIAEGIDLEKHIVNFKSYTARKTIDYLKSEYRNLELEFLREAKLKYRKDREYQVWDEGYHPKQIINDRMMIQKVEYIHYNPVKAGLVNNATDWLWSSATFHAGGDSNLALTLFGDWGAPTRSVGAR